MVIDLKTWKLLMCFGKRINPPYLIQCLVIKKVEAVVQMCSVKKMFLKI